MSATMDGGGRSIGGMCGAAETFILSDLSKMIDQEGTDRPSQPAGPYAPARGQSTRLPPRCVYLTLGTE